MALTRRNRSQRGRGRSGRPAGRHKSRSFSDSDSKSSKNRKRKNRNKSKPQTKSKSLVLLRVFVYYMFAAVMYMFQVYCSWRKFWHADYGNVSRSSLMKMFDFRVFDMFHLRDDEISEDIVEDLPFVSPVWNPFSTYLARLGYAIAIPGLEVKVYKEGRTEIERKASRVAFFDSMINQTHVKQVVILDAEFDSRAYDDDLLNNRVDIIYEVGRKALMKKKRKKMKSAGRDLSHVVYVPANIRETDSDWGKQLVRNGYDPRRSTLFICEEVLFSNRSRVAEDIVGIISDFLEKNPESYLAFDYFDAFSVRRNILSLFMAPFNITNVWFGIPKAGKKNGARSAEKWVKGLSLSVVEHVRMDKIGYGFMKVTAADGEVDSSSESESESDSDDDSSSDSDSDSDSGSSDSDSASSG